MRREILCLLSHFETARLSHKHEIIKQARVTGHVK